MTYWNNRLKNPAIDVANYFYQQTAYKRLFGEYYRSHEWLPYQQPIVEAFINKQ
jgi:hypothetical protein